MDDVREDFLAPPHGTTPAADITHKMKSRSLESSEYINEKGVGHIMVSAKENYCNFAHFNRVVHTCMCTKTSKI